MIGITLHYFGISIALNFLVSFVHACKRQTHCSNKTQILMYLIHTSRTKFGGGYSLSTSIEILKHESKNFGAIGKIQS